MGYQRVILKVGHLVPVLFCSKNAKQNRYRLHEIDNYVNWWYNLKQVMPLLAKKIVDLSGQHSYFK